MKCCVSDQFMCVCVCIYIFVRWANFFLMTTSMKYSIMTVHIEIAEPTAS